MRTLMLATWFLAGCTPPDAKVDDTSGEADADTDADTDADADLDRDGDGFPDSTDCDDTRASVNPSVATDPCNGLDDDCDEEIDEDPDLLWYVDDDGDGFGDLGGNATDAQCALGAGFATNDADCDDANVDVYPGAPDSCDGLDNDCDGDPDNDPGTWTSFPADSDGDGAGDPLELVYGCTVPRDGADNAWDCDDRDPSEPVFVSPDGSSRGTGRVDSPLRSLQSAISASSTCVVAYAGDYTEDIDFEGRNIHLRGLEGSAATRLHGSGRDSVVTFQNGETSAATLEGFTVTGGAGHLVASSSTYTSGTVTYYSYYYYYYGGGIYVSGANPTLIDVVITENTMPEQATVTYSTTTEYTDSFGGGIYAEYGGATLEDVGIYANESFSGAAMQMESSEIYATRLDISGNGGTYPTVYQSGGTLTIDALIFDANWTDRGYGMMYTTSGTLQIRNGALLSGDMGIFNGGSNVILTSSVVSGNTYGIYDASPGLSTWDITYNDVYGNTENWYELENASGTNGNVSTPPRFANWVNDADYVSDDLTLSAASALIDAGDPDGARNDVDGTRNDIGPFGGPEGSW